VRNRGIGRGRMFMGALLLLAAVITWGIGLTMSPHGETVAKGTEHVRPAIVGMIEKGAIGTIILSAIGAWRLLPGGGRMGRARDWALLALLTILVTSSLYTLIWLYTSVVH
jgi:hypothetical protein